jgi:hypothetical protein
VSRPRFARRVRGQRALTLAFAPRLILQLSGGCQISSSTNRAPHQIEPLLNTDLPRLSSVHPDGAVDTLSPQPGQNALVT